MSPSAESLPDRPSGGRTCQIKVRYPNGQVLYFSSEESRIYVGRGQGNDVRLPHTFVSTRHLLIQALDQGHLVTDLGSAEGTWINGERLAPHTPHPLHTGEHLWIGPLAVELEVVFDAYVLDEPTIERVDSEPDQQQQRRLPRPRPGTLELESTKVFEELEAPVSSDSGPAPIWQIQTGIGSAPEGASGPHPEAESTAPQPTAEESFSGMHSMLPKFDAAPRNAPTRSRTPAKVQAPVDLPWGLFLQIIGGTIFFAAMVFLIVLVLL